MSAHCGSVSVVEATYLWVLFNATPIGWACISSRRPHVSANIS